MCIVTGVADNAIENINRHGSARPGMESFILHARRVPLHALTIIKKAHPFIRSWCWAGSSNKFLAFYYEMPQIHHREGLLRKINFCHHFLIARSHSLFLCSVCVRGRKKKNIIGN
jgi:hypothetical protein